MSADWAAPSARLLTILQECQYALAACPPPMPPLAVKRELGSARIDEGDHGEDDVRKRRFHSLYRSALYRSCLLPIMGPEAHNGERLAREMFGQNSELALLERSQRLVELANELANFLNETSHAEANRCDIDDRTEDVCGQGCAPESDSSACGVKDFLSDEGQIRIVLSWASIFAVLTCLARRNKVDTLTDGRQSEIYLAAVRALDLGLVYGQLQGPLAELMRRLAPTKLVWTKWDGEDGDDGLTKQLNHVRAMLPSDFQEVKRYTMSQVKGCVPLVSGADKLGPLVSMRRPFLVRLCATELNPDAFGLPIEDKSLEGLLRLLLRHGGRHVPIETGETYVHQAWKVRMRPLAFLLPSHRSVPHVGSSAVESDTARDPKRAPSAAVCEDFHRRRPYLAQYALHHHIPDFAAFLPQGEHHEALIELSNLSRASAGRGADDDGGMELNFWLSFVHTLSAFHTDPYANLFFQAVGRKEFLLAPPNCKVLTARKNYLKNTASDDPHRVRPEVLASCEVAEVGAGDILFIPQSWWHRVQSLSPSLSVSHWL